MATKLPIYKTNEIAKLVGVSKNTLIRWEEEGLIPPAMRDGRGWRVWTKDALEKIIEIKKTKEFINKNYVPETRLIVNIIGYGNQGLVWAKNLKDSGVYVNVLLQEKSNSIRNARRDGFEVLGIEKSLRSGGIFCLLIPDEEHELFFKKYRGAVNDSCFFIFAHGYSVGYLGIDVNARKALLAPKGIATAVRFNYLEGKRTPACIYAESSSDEKIVKKLAGLLGLYPLIKASFLKEAVSDLFTEQAILCGGVPAIMFKTFEILKKNGIPEELIVQECIQELSYILDVIKKQGLYGMYKAISPAAFSGGLMFWEELDKGASLNEVLDKTLDDISSKEFISQDDKFDRSEELENIKKKVESFDHAINNLNHMNLDYKITLDKTEEGGTINVPD